MTWEWSHGGRGREINAKSLNPRVPLLELRPVREMHRILLWSTHKGVKRLPATLAQFSLRIP